jgi:hypothetical protein
MEETSKGTSLLVKEDKEVESMLPIALKNFIMPDGWKMQESAITTKNKPVTVCACPHPIFPVERLRNTDRKTEKLHLVFNRDGRWRDIVVDASMVAHRTSIVKLADYGVQVTSENAKHLVTYISDSCTANRNRIPIRNGLSRLGWVSLHQFSPYDNALDYDGDRDFENLYLAVRKSGQYEEWLRVMQKLRDYYCSRFIFGVSEEEAWVEAIQLGIETLNGIDKAVNADPIQRAWDIVQDWLISNAIRFDMDYSGIMPRLGWNNGEDMWWVIPSMLEDMLIKANLNPEKIIRGFVDKGIITTKEESDGKRRTIVKYFKGCRQRVYEIQVSQNGNDR